MTWGKDEDVFRTRKVVHGYTEKDLSQAAKHLAKAARLLDYVTEANKKAFLAEITGAVDIIKACVKRRKERQS